MKTSLKVIIACLTLSLVIIGSAGCSKKEPSPTAAEIAATEAAERAAAEAKAREEAEAAAAAAAAAAAKAEAEAKARAEAEAEALALAAAKAEAEAKAKAEAEAAAAAAAKAEAERIAREKAEAAAKAAAAAEAAAKAAAAEAARVAQQERAARLYMEHSQSAEAFKEDMSALSILIDRNADTVTVPVADNLLEMRKLMPELEAKFESLKEYKGDNLDATVADIKAESEKTKNLYRETMELLPEDLRAQL